MITSSKVLYDCEFIDPCLCSAWVATAIIGAAGIGAATTAYTAKKASEAQVKAADKAANTSLGMYERTRADLEPFRQVGIDASGRMEGKLDEFTSPIVMDQAALEKTPGYQFNLSQGLKAAQNSAAARGLGKSGAALKGATAFATGLADSTYRNQFDMANINQTNAYNRLKGLIDVGASAAAGTGTAGTAAAGKASDAQIGAGNAEAAGLNAIGKSVSNFANNVGGYFAYRGLYGDNSSAPSYASGGGGSGKG